MTGLRRTQLLQRLHLLVVALVTIVTAGLVSPGAVVARLTHPSGVAAKAGQRHAVRWTASRPFARPQDSAARSAFDRDAIVVDIADDDLDDDDGEQRGATRPHVASHAATPFRGARLSRRPSWDLRGHPQFDRPRFRTGRGLLRGPPT